MVLNLSQLIKSSGTRTVPAAETKSIGLSADAQLSWFLQSHLDSFTETPNSAPPTGIRPSTWIIPSGSFTVTQDSQPSTGILPSRQLCLDNETFSHLPGLFIWTKSSQPSTRIVQKLMSARAAVGNSIKPPGRYKKYAVSWSVFGFPHCK
jgi:hypothetical protein